MAKIRRFSDVKGANSGLRTRYKNGLRTEQSIQVLEEARAVWDALANWRRKARRARDYTFGKQWNDLVRNPEYGKANEPQYITEEMHIARQGKTPLKNNMIRALVRAISGQFLQSYSEPIAVAADRDDQLLGETATVLMQYNYTRNEMREIDWQLLLRLTISGACVAKVGHGYRADRGSKDTWVNYVNPNNCFWSVTNNDVRLWDVDLIGEFADMDIENVVAMFAQSESEAEAIRDIYGRPKDRYYGYVQDNLDARKVDNVDFLLPTDVTNCRVIEVWRRETKRRYLCHDWAEGTIFKVEKKDLKEIDAENETRLYEAGKMGVEMDDVALIDYESIMDRVWVARWMTPWGDVLREVESPYAHGGHPYVLGLYPNYDGEVHSFVDDIIDQQKYINRLITMYDFIMGASAKGVLMIPEECIPNGMTPEDFADEWVRYNGVIVYKARPGYPIPQQVSSNATNVGVIDMARMQMQLMTEISGISGALQGKQAKSGTASSLYAQESQNSANNLVELLTMFTMFRERRDKKMLQCDLQFYDEAMYINLVGMDASEDAKQYNPERIKDVAFDVRIVEGLDTPAYRQIANDMLLQFYQSGQVSLKAVLEVGAFPFADKLKRAIEREEREAQQAQQQAMEAQQMAALQQQGDEMPQSDISTVQSVNDGTDASYAANGAETLQQMIPKDAMAIANG